MILISFWAKSKCFNEMGEGKKRNYTLEYIFCHHSTSSLLLFCFVLFFFAHCERASDFSPLPPHRPHSHNTLYAFLPPAFDAAAASATPGNK